MNSRRQFLVASSAAVAAAAFPKNLFAERQGGELFSNASLGAYSQGLMTQAHFESVVGSTFTIFLDNDAAGHLTLMSVTAAANNTASTVKSALVKAAPAPSTTSFHLTFNVGGPAFSQDTYLVDHGTLGRFAMFLVPGAGQQATAAFNYLGDSRAWQFVSGPSPSAPAPSTPAPSTPARMAPIQAPVVHAPAVKTSLRVVLPTD